MSRTAKRGILTKGASYCSDKLAQHGQSPLDEDRNGEESQVLRFAQLCKIIESPSGFSVNDLECGHGALYDSLDQQCAEFAYCGIDVSEGMIAAAQQLYADISATSFIVSSEHQQVAEYAVASDYELYEFTILVRKQT